MLREEIRGLSGNVTDKKFGEVVDYLETNGQLVSETETANGVIGSVQQLYKVNEDLGGLFNRIYLLQYQIRTPRTPRGTEFLYEFSDITDLTSPLP